MPCNHNPKYPCVECAPDLYPATSTPIHEKLEAERKKVAILQAAIEAAHNCEGSDDEIFNGLAEAVRKTS